MSLPKLFVCCLIPSLPLAVPPTPVILQRPSGINSSATLSPSYPSSRHNAYVYLSFLIASKSSNLERRYSTSNF